ncbi:MAG: YtxH domain-containing protein [Anaerolineae bacterium]|nr:YtxH domain-containing protein [Anaerolineae bacterium]
MVDRMYYSHEAERRAYAERLALAAIVLITGLGIGTLLALLFAPQSGDKTRRSIASSAEDILDEGRSTGTRVVEGVVDGVDRIRRTMEERVKRA